MPLQITGMGLKGKDTAQRGRAPTRQALEWHPFLETHDLQELRLDRAGRAKWGDENGGNKFRWG